jgi:hypothetical protein
MDPHLATIVDYPDGSSRPDFVPSQDDMRIPTEKKNKFVRVEGEFKAAGVYQVGQGVTLRQVVPARAV